MANNVPKASKPCIYGEITTQKIRIAGEMQWFDTLIKA